MISYAEALSLIDATVTPSPPESRSLAGLLGAATVGPIASRLDVPPFANAAMDGFALRAADTADASAERAATFDVAGVVAAGDSPPAAPSSNACMEIMTGAPMPAECDTVIPIERVATETDANGRILRIRIEESSRPGRNVRASGEDFTAGSAATDHACLLEPHSLMALAATGNDIVDVRAAQRVAIITTGSELTAADAPDRPGTIRDSNGPYLEAAIARVGAVLTRRANAADQPEQLDAAFAAAADDADIVLTTGGVSAGRFDLVPDAIVRAGGEIVFHKVAIRPGKPLLFARLPGGKLVFGLPGNPIAAAVGLRFFALRALRRRLGLPPECFHAAVSDDEVRKRADLYFFGKAQAHVDDGGTIHTRLLPGQESFKIKPLASANCWAVVPDGRDAIARGDLIQVAPLYPSSFLQT
ncbi:MAG: molybdopterin molybdotransferase MoeA [Gammaproteobacteria bacterium]